MAKPVAIKTKEIFKKYFKADFLLLGFPDSICSSFSCTFFSRSLASIGQIIIVVLISRKCVIKKLISNYRGPHLHLGSGWSLKLPNHLGE